MQNTRLKTLDRFEVLAVLGRGAASRILHVRDPESREHYAMKVVVRRTAEEQKFLDQAKHEYAVAQELDHPSLIKVYDIRVKRRWFREREVRTLLEYVNGRSLQHMRQLPVPLLVVVFDQVAGAVSHMHQRNVFHADLKPNNVMISQSGQVKVIDFGLAWLRSQPKHRVQGTVGYLAPEQILTRVVNEQTDVYNLGATMYRMLTGRVVSGEPSAGHAHYISSAGMFTPAHELNPEVPLELSDLVRQCCEPKPKKRPQTMAACAESLGRISRNLGLSDKDLPELLRRHARTLRSSKRGQEPFA